MADNRSIAQLEEKMKMLLLLIEGGKISTKKKIELQEEYCFLQREYELMTNGKG